MKKKLRKLTLHRETLRALSTPELRLPVGAETQDTCRLDYSGPCFACITIEFQSCDSCANC
ncbi:MAG TPA: hypothetical protein VF173_01215 [Thermoanaerobaculia bacterium]|nr:hypothetical protein [Thermoanaerobaculia bacterium]